MNEEKYQARADWLNDRGYTESDVMEEDGVEYVIAENEDDQGVHKKVVELPQELQTNPRV
jgi:predicted TIM-barrel enzyme